MVRDGQGTGLPRKRTVAASAGERKVLIVGAGPARRSCRGAAVLTRGYSGHEPLRRDRPSWSDTLQTGDGRRLLESPEGAGSPRELDRLEKLLLEQIQGGGRRAGRDTACRATSCSAGGDVARHQGHRAGVRRDPLVGRALPTLRQTSTPSRSTPGLAPTPWQSDRLNREQGVSKAGNPRLRTTLIQLAWLWLRHQPQSALALWFEERVKHNGGRLKKTTIVALARKLLVALWKYVTAGVVIEGVVMKRA